MIEVTKNILEHSSLNQMVKGKTENNSFVITKIYDNLIVIKDKLEKNISNCKSQEEINKVIARYKNKHDNHIIQLFSNDILKKQISKDSNQKE